MYVYIREYVVNRYDNHKVKITIYATGAGSVVDRAMGSPEMNGDLGDSRLQINLNLRHLRPTGPQVCNGTGE